MEEEYLLPHVASEVETAISKALTSVQTVNGKTPDKNGNVEITIPDSSPNVELDTTLTVEGKAADAAAVGKRLSVLEGMASGDGLTVAQINALDGMFKVAAYDDTKDVSGAYAAFRAAFGLAGGEEPDIPVEPDEPETKTYIITNELVNVTSSNSATSITEGASYTATLTAAEGYELDTVSVLMCGVDVTADVYADGVISIASVTGNVEIVASAVKEEVEIEAVLPEDGLMAYFDLRSATNSAGWTPTQGDADLFQLKKANTWDTLEDPDQYGAFVGNGTYGGVTLQSRDSAEGEFADMNLGTEFTVVTLAYSPVDGGLLGLKDYLGVDGYGAFYPYAPYIKSDDSIASGTRTQNIENKAKANTYHTIVVRVDNKLLEIYWNGNVVHTGNGDDYEDFLRWSDATSIRSVKGRNEGKLTAAAFYNKALTGVEIVELIEYLKTLEVTA